MDKRMERPRQAKPKKATAIPPDPVYNTSVTYYMAKDRATGTSEGTLVSLANVFRRHGVPRGEDLMKQPKYQLSSGHNSAVCALRQKEEPLFRPLLDGDVVKYWKYDTCAQSGKKKSFFWRKSPKTSNVSRSIENKKSASKRKLGNPPGNASSYQPAAAHISQFSAHQTSTGPTQITADQTLWNPVEYGPDHPHNCQICRSGYSPDQSNLIMLCDGCDKGYHMHCLNPPLYSIPDGDWYCPLSACQSKRRKAEQLKVAVPQSVFTAYLVHCLQPVCGWQYLWDDKNPATPLPDRASRAKYLCPLCHSRVQWTEKPLSIPVASLIGAGAAGVAATAAEAAARQANANRAASKQQKKAKKMVANTRVQRDTDMSPEEFDEEELILPGESEFDPASKRQKRHNDSDDDISIHDGISRIVSRSTTLAGIAEIWEGPLYFRGHIACRMKAYFVGGIDTNVLPSWPSRLDLVPIRDSVAPKGTFGVPTNVNVWKFDLEPAIEEDEDGYTELINALCINGSPAYASAIINDEFSFYVMAELRHPGHYHQLRGIMLPPKDPEEEEIPEIEQDDPEIEQDAPEIEQDDPEIEQDDQFIEQDPIYGSEIEQDDPEIEQDAPEIEQDDQFIEQDPIYGSEIE